MILLLRCGRLKRIIGERKDGIEINNCISHAKLKTSVIPPKRDLEKIV